ncbi:MAG: hypothetical protein DWQ01_08160 [Planctomycetota bacterium]|nr:MAG: hypothetical protein DWQ01_08160 [Planctomycetota bacterium]
MSRYELFLDESGRFLETSTDPEERRKARSDQPPSQLAGLWVPGGSLQPKAAEKALEVLAEKAGGKRKRRWHGSEFRPGPEFDRLVLALCEYCREQAWQPVRLVNRERVRYGDRATTYTAMVAELVLRLLQKQRYQDTGRIRFRLVAAVVKLGEEQDGSPILMEEKLYRQRIQEALAQAAVRRGLAAENRLWELQEFRLASARRWPELMLCDLISNASYGDFRKLGTEARAAMQACFGEFDITLTVQELLQRLDGLLHRDAFGQAMLTISEGLVEKGLRPQFLSEADLRRHKLIDELAEIGAPARDPHFAMVLDALSEKVKQQPDAAVGASQLQWLRSKVVSPLQRRLRDLGSEETLLWFDFGLQLQQVEAALQRGDWAGAQPLSQDLLPPDPALASRFEYAELLLQARLTQARYHLAVWEPEIALALVEPVAAFYQELGQLFHVALEGLFAEQMQADRRGQALLLALKARCLIGGEACLPVSQLAEEALQEFDSPAERAQVRRLRVLLACEEQQWEAAASELARALGSPACDPASLWQALEGQGWPSSEAVANGLCWLQLHVRREAVEGEGPETAAVDQVLAGAEEIDSMLEEAAAGAGRGIEWIRWLSAWHALRGQEEVCRRVLASLPDRGRHPGLGPNLWSWLARWQSAEALVKAGAYSGIRAALQALDADPGENWLPALARQIPKACSKLQQGVERLQAAYQQDCALQPTDRRLEIYGGWL